MNKNFHICFGGASTLVVYADFIHAVKWATAIMEGGPGDWSTKIVPSEILDVKIHNINCDNILALNFTFEISKPIDNIEAMFYAITMIFGDKGKPIHFLQCKVIE